MTEKVADVLLVGGGVMSATLGSLLTQLDPSLKIIMVEQLTQVADESTDGWNNAGTGHAGYCELNYTPQDAQGNIEINRALAINASFEVTLQFWSSLVESGALNPRDFINPSPHQSFVWGEQDVAFLRQRHTLLSAHHLFKDMEFSTDPAVLRDWMPLVMTQRTDNQPVAATRVEYGSDVDFGSLTRNLVKHLKTRANFELLLGHRVKNLRQQADGRWHVRVKDKLNGGSTLINAGFVFLGAGGGALPLLQKSRIPEGRGYGGFPVSGQWLVCDRPEVVARHNSKVYGKAALGAPPMSVPHLDTRIINGKPTLLFGPYAGFTTKFLKQGSSLDLFKSIRTNNLRPLMSAGLDNMDLTRYLIGEVFQSHQDRVATLRQFFPQAQEGDWKLAQAGQRVQIIKKSADGRGKLEFGTELVAAKDGTLAALLGASPGASVAVRAMIDVLERCFKDRMNGDWHAKLKAMVPSYGESLVDDAALLARVREWTNATLGLTPSSMSQANHSEYQVC